VIDPDEKEAVENALIVLVRLEGIEKRYQEANDLHTKRKSQNENRWTTLLGLVHQMSPEQTVSAGVDLEKYAKAVRDQVEKEVDEARKKQQRALIANSAAELVKELHHGEPCPVCGSREHPLPAQATGELGGIESEIKAVEDRLRKVRDWEGELLKIWHDWLTNESLVKESREQLEEIEDELKNTAAEFEKARGKYSRDELRRRKQEFIDFEKQLQRLDEEREKLRKTQSDLNEKLQKLNDSYQNDRIKEASLQAELANYQSQLEEIIEGINQITGGADLNDLIRDLSQKYEQIDTAVKDRKSKAAEARIAMETLAREIAALNATVNASRNELGAVAVRLTNGQKNAGFNTLEEAEAALLDPVERQTIRQHLELYRQEVAVSRSELEQLEREINHRRFEAADFEELKIEREKHFQALEQLKTETALAQKRLEELRGKQERWNELQQRKVRAEKRKGLAEDLLGLIRGRRFVSFLAQEHLREMTLEASYQLGRLTGQRYALELAKEKDCEFVIRDDYNGGARRMINSLSGGEIFMTSLALALALSSKIQLRGKYPLGFFFLDEGFGSLDEEKLDKVMNALEKLHDKNRMVGVISHVREMKERLPRYLEVIAAGEDGSGSKING
ncbi:MAG: SbcC/MukB-like Walker B domain-containing protein, partial [Bacteroidota bacterium]